MTTQNDASAKGTAVSPSWTWGSSTRLIFDVSGEPGTSVSASAQLAQVSLPEPAVCSLYIQARLITGSPVDVIRTFTLNLLEGIGRVTVPRQVSFADQPGTLSPIEFTLPWVPVHALNVNVEAVLDHGSETPNPVCEVEVFLVLSPLTRIPQKEQMLAFGMAMPGEADDLDDGLREDLETEGPTAQQAVLNGLASDQDGSSPEVEGDDEEEGDDDAPELTPLQRLAVAFEDRHGRRPTRIELQTIVQRIRSKRARRSRRA
jgi:hypothetical protein